MKPNIPNRELTEVDAIIAIHKNSLSNDLFSKLQTSFLKKIYSRWLRSKATKILTVKIDNSIVGFLVLSIFPKLTQKELMANTIHLFFTLLCLIICHPGRLAELIALYRLGFATSKKDILEQNIPEIYFMAVAPLFQRKGIGKMLINEAKNLLSNKDINSLLVKTSSVEGRKFYEKNNFICIEEEKRGKRKLHVMKLIIK